MHFVCVFGPPAVGKMTVGHEIARLTGFKLFHNAGVPAEAGA